MLAPQKKLSLGEESVPELEKKITFYPLPAVDIDLTESEGEYWSIWEKDQSHYDPAGPVECSVLSCSLEHGLPEKFLAAPEPTKTPEKAEYHV
jgi:hypothetical protein